MSKNFAQNIGTTSPLQPVSSVRYIQAENITRAKIEYKNEMFKEYCDLLAIKTTQIMSLIGHNSSSTIRRWFAGGDMYVTNLARLCSELGFDFLRFFKYNGHEFETSLEELYELEKTGIKVSDLLRNIENIKKDEPIKEESLFTEEELDEAGVSLPADINYTRYLESSNVSAADINDKMALLRTKIKNEMRKYDSMCAEMMDIIKQKDLIITNLQNENVRMKKVIDAATTIAAKTAIRVEASNNEKRKNKEINAPDTINKNLDNGTIIA